MKNAIIIILLLTNIVTPWAVGHFVKKQCDDTVDWAVQDTMDWLAIDLHVKMRTLLTQCNMAAQECVNQ